MTSPRLPDPREQPFMRVDEVAAALRDFSVSSTYEAIHAGQIPAIRVGRRFRIPTAAIWQLAGLDPTSNSTLPGAPSIGPDNDEAGVATPAAVTATPSGGAPHDGTTLRAV